MLASNSGLGVAPPSRLDRSLAPVDSLVGPWSRAPPGHSRARRGSALGNLARMSTPSTTTLAVRKEGSVLFAEIAAPPMNLLGPDLVRDLVSLIQEAESDEGCQVLVFTSGDPDYFISHVDLTKIDEYRAEAAKLTGEASIALLFHHLSASRLVTIAQIEGRVRSAGSEFVLACDMRFAARETAIFGQFEPAFGLLPGGGAAQHLTRLMGRGGRSRSC